MLSLRNSVVALTIREVNKLPVARELMGEVLFIFSDRVTPLLISVFYIGSKIRLDVGSFLYSKHYHTRCV